jgi:hypothetical protein
VQKFVEKSIGGVGVFLEVNADFTSEFFAASINSRGKPFEKTLILILILFLLQNSAGKNLAHFHSVERTSALPAEIDLDVFETKICRWGFGDKFELPRTAFWAVSFRHNPS